LVGFFPNLLSQIRIDKANLDFWCFCENSFLSFQYSKLWYYIG